jgi:uncharacterized surface anchored protein
LRYQLIRGGIEILKTNIKGEPLQGAKFALYDLADNLIAQAETGSDGKAKFSDIPYGRTISWKSKTHVCIW